ncbi:MAG: hypothetical protein ACO28M_04535 [Vulcanococcus sp.]
MKWVRADEEIAMEIGLNLRTQDQHEVMLSHGVTGLEAVLESYLQSDICQAIEGDDGVPVGITGVCDDRIWLLGTYGLTATKSHRYQLCLHGREWVDYCLEEAGGFLRNMVYSKNTGSIRWLKHLGFAVEEPQPFGPSAALFCPFWRKL